MIAAIARDWMTHRGGWSSRKPCPADWIEPESGWRSITPFKWGEAPLEKLTTAETGIGLAALRELIKASRWILSLEQDWDGERSGPVEEETWQRATRFLENQAEWLLANYGLPITAPTISPGPEGSIDIYWDTSTFELLVNVPSDPSKRASFYGDDRGNIFIKGTLETELINHGLLTWFRFRL